MVTYAYGEVSITRIDECSRTSFYYTKGHSDSAGKIWVEYSGINDGFSGYLKFHDNGKVTLLSGDGYFQSEGIDHSHFEYKRIAAYERPELNASVYEILLATNYEIEKNQEFESKVKATYSIDENEWWQLKK